MYFTLQVPDEWQPGQERDESPNAILLRDVSHLLHY